MHRIDIPEKRLMREFASEVGEMTEDQFIYFIDLVLQYLSGHLTITRLKILLIRKLLRINGDMAYIFLDKEEQEHCNSEVFRLSELCDSFFEEIERDGQKVKSFKLSFTRNFIPKICGRYYGPKDALQNVTFGEYRMAHSFFTAYISSKNEEDLNRLVATLYRPAKPLLWIRRLLPSFDGNIRVSITSKSNPLLLEKRVKRIASLPIAVRYGIFLFFSGCEEFLAKGSVTVDGKLIDFSIIYERPENSEDSPDIGLIGILFSLAETKVFGSIEETDQQNLYDIMIRLYQVVKQSKALEAKYKSYGSD